MAVRGFFYNSVNKDRLYNGQDMNEDKAPFYKEGVAYGHLQVTADGESMAVKVDGGSRTGYAYINLHTIHNTTVLELPVSGSNGTLPRIDRVILRNDETERKPSIFILEGAYSSNPQPPELTNNDTIQEKCLAEIYVAAGAVAISQRDITDTRADTKLCGFIASQFQDIDFSIFQNQFDSWFLHKKNTVDNDHKEFVEEYKALTKSFVNSEEIKWNKWFNEKQTQLSGDIAGKLQIQIDEIKDMGICLIKVDCEEFFKGKSVTATNGTESYSMTVPNAAPYNLLFKVKDVGTWSISHGEYSTSVSVPYFGVYSTTLSQGDIKITVNYDTEFEGKVISAKNGSTIRTKTAAGGSVSLMVNVDGTWEISAELDGKTYKSSVTVQHGHEYTVQLSKVGYQEWLKAGGVTTTFASLEEILADEKTIRQLITRHASSDYLAEWLSNDTEDVSRQILNNDIIAKWINLRDYALDKLYSYPAVKSIMDGLKKYGYGEWVQADGAWQAKGNVPIMTSNAAPYGELKSDSAPNPAWYSFNPLQGGWSTADTVKNAYIQYKFINPCAVKKISFDPYCYGAARCNGYEILAGNDNSKWDSLYTGVAENVSQSTINEIDINNDKFYTYYRFHIKSSHSNSAGLKSLQFYGKEIKPCVLPMTNVTASWGEIIFNASDFQPTAYPPLNCFKGSMTNGTIANNGSAWIGYDFKNPIVINGFKFHGRDNGYKGFSENAKIQGTNDLSQWNDVALNIGNSSFGTDVFKFFENKMAYRYWRVIDNAPYRWGVYSINFYGFDYSECGKRNWIYDRGVSLYPLTISETNAFANIDTTDYKLLRAVNTGHATINDSLKCGSGTALVNGLPDNNYLDISSINGSNDTGWGNRNTRYLDETSLWLE